jgi:uncharacterized peroxidase-related enzyme
VVKAVSYLDTSLGGAHTKEAALLRERDAASWGFVPNFAVMFSVRPAVYEAWRQLNGAIKSSMDARRYELATIAAAAALRSSYCTLAHGRILARDHFSPDDVVAMISAPDSAPLTATDRAVMDFARKVALHADQITEPDIAALRDCGLADDEILDVALAAAARCFFSKTLDATGTPPDATFNMLEPRLRDALTVGRPIAAGSPAPSPTDL